MGSQNSHKLLLAISPVAIFQTHEGKGGGRNGGNISPVGEPVYLYNNSNKSRGKGSKSITPDFIYQPTFTTQIIEEGERKMFIDGEGGKRERRKGRLRNDLVLIYFWLKDSKESH